MTRSTIKTGKVQFYRYQDCASRKEKNNSFFFFRKRRKKIQLCVPVSTCINFALLYSDFCFIFSFVYMWTDRRTDTFLHFDCIVHAISNTELWLLPGDSPKTGVSSSNSTRTRPLRNWPGKKRSDEFSKRIRNLSNLRPPCGAIEPTSLKRDISWSLLLFVLAPKRRNVYVDDAVFFFVFLIHRETTRVSAIFFQGIESADEIVCHTGNFKAANLLMNLCKIIKKNKV